MYLTIVTFVTNFISWLIKSLWYAFRKEDMKKSDYKKKAWTKPAVHALSIRKDTFSGSQTGPEGAGKGGPPLPPTKK